MIGVDSRKADLLQERDDGHSGPATIDREESPFSAQRAFVDRAPA
jgi:hypothetical protein